MDGQEEGEEVDPGVFAAINYDDDDANGTSDVDEVAEPDSSGFVAGSTRRYE